MTEDRCVNAKLCTDYELPREGDNIAWGVKRIKPSDFTSESMSDLATDFPRWIVPTTKTPRGIRKTGGGGCSK